MMKKFLTLLFLVPALLANAQGTPQLDYFLTSAPDKNYTLSSPDDDYVTGDKIPIDAVFTDEWIGYGTEIKVLLNTGDTITMEFDPQQPTDLLDPEWGVPGKTNATHNGEHYGISCIFELEDKGGTYPDNSGRMVIAGGFYDYEETPNDFLVITDNDGVLYKGFGKRTSSPNPTQPLNDEVRWVIETQDGGLLLGGEFTDFGGFASYDYLVKLKGDFTIDHTFMDNLCGSTNGVGGNPALDGQVGERAPAIVSPGRPGYCMVQDADGRIYIAGRFTEAGGTVRRGVVKLNADGTLDTSFDAGFTSGWGASLAIDGTNIWVGAGGSTNWSSGPTVDKLEKSTGNRASDYTSSFSFSSNEGVLGVVVMPEPVDGGPGGVLVTGRITSDNGSGSWHIVSLQDNGSVTPHSTFKLDLSGIGSGSTNFDGRWAVDGFALLKDKIWIGIHEGVRINGHGSLYVLNLDGSVNTAFQKALTKDLTTWNFGFGDNDILSVYVDNDNRLLVGGNYRSFMGAGEGASDDDDRITRLTFYRATGEYIVSADDAVRKLEIVEVIGGPVVDAFGTPQGSVSPATPGLGTTFGENHFLTVNLSQLQSSIYYDGNGNTGGTAPVDAGNPHLEGDTIIVPGSNGLTKNSACFIGWSDAAGRKDSVTNLSEVPSLLFQPGDTVFMGEPDTTLYAVWAIDSTGPEGNPDSIPDYLQFEVTYDANFSVGSNPVGTAPVDDNLYNDFAPGDTATVLGKNGIKIDSACFMGWTFDLNPGLILQASDTAGLNLKSAGDKITITQDTTLYAVWFADSTGPNGVPDCEADFNQFEVTYDANFSVGSNPVGTVPVDDNLYNDAAPGNEATVLDNLYNLGLDSACFMGWTLTQNPGLILQAADTAGMNLKIVGDKITITQDTTLYAVWFADSTGPGGAPDCEADFNQFEVTYDANFSVGTNPTGAVPVDDNLYNDAAPGNEATVLDNLYNLGLDSACFMGWTLTQNPGLILQAADTAGMNLKIAGDKIAITQDTTLYAVWFADSTGPGGIPDCKADFNQFEVTYDRTIGTVTGEVPVDDNLYDVAPDNVVTVLDNAGGPPNLELADAVFIGWSFGMHDSVLTLQASEPADLMQPGATITLNPLQDTTLYAVWAKDTKSPGGGPDSIPDYKQYGVVYDKNTPSGIGSVVTGNVPVDGNLYNPHDSALVQGNTGMLDLDSACWIGWSTTQYGLITDAAMEAAAMANLKVANDSVYVPASGGETLYAVWLADSTGPNGIPDCIADFNQFGVTYDANYPTGGLNQSGTVPEDNNLYDDGTSATVMADDNLDVDSACFIGWSTTKHPLLTIDTTGMDIGLKVANDLITMTQDTMLYAVWIADSTGPGGIPDCIADFNQFGVTYDANYPAGSLNESGTVPEDNNLYDDGTSATVMADNNLDVDSACFIGWSTTQHPLLTIDTTGMDIGLKVANDLITMTQDTMLYAVWIADSTGPGGIPDCIADFNQFGVTYDKTITAAIGNVPVDDNLYDDVVAGNDVATVLDNAGVPQNLKLADAVFIGWSFGKHDSVLTLQASEPADLTQPGDMITLNPLQDTTLYAVWAIDVTGPGGMPDSIPDYKQDGVLYDANYAFGSNRTGTVPEDGNLYNPGDSALVLGNLNSLDIDSACFIGWSTTRHPLITDVATETAAMADLKVANDSVFVSGTVTLYGVWIADSTGPGGVPDCEADFNQFEVTYDANYAFGSNQTGTAPIDDNLYNEGDNATVMTNSDLDIDSACFIGWSTTRHGLLATDTTGMGLVIYDNPDQITIATPGADVTLYAVWIADSTGPGGIPDCIADFNQFEVTYDKTLTAATGNVPVDDNRYDSGNSATVLGNTGVPSNLELANAVFRGWSSVKHDSIITTATGYTSIVSPTLIGSSIPVTQDTLLYAVWAEDITGPGGTPDSIPDFLQGGVLYDKTIATSGNAPEDGNLYNPGDSALVLGNVGVPPMAYTDAMFIGWSQAPLTSVPVARKADLAPYLPLVQPGDSIDPGVISILYAIWAEDKSGPTGIPDNVPDYLQFEVVYKGNMQTGGTPPEDINLYDSLNTVTVWGNVSPLTRTNACFIGWSADSLGIVTTQAGEPGDLKQAGETFSIVSDTTFYAVWAVDYNGPTGVPDSVPDYLQKKLTYHYNTLFGTGGSLPSPDSSRHNTGSTVVIMAGNLTASHPTDPAKCVVLAGWTTSDSASLVVTPYDVPATGMYYAGNPWVANADLDLYAVWAEDADCNGVADFNEPYLAVNSTFRWPEREDSGDPSNADYDRTKPNWYAEHDAPGETTIYAGCKLLFDMAIAPAPYDRTFKLNLLGGALESEYLTDMDGNPLPETYFMPAGSDSYTFNFLMKECPASLEGQSVIFEAEFIGLGIPAPADQSDEYVLYNHPSYDDIVIPTKLTNNRIDFGLTGGSPNLMMSLNGRNWKSITEPLNVTDKLAVTDGVSVWLREPAGCWQEQFFFRRNIDPNIRRYVELPLTDGVTINPGAGKHYIDSREDFIFTASYARGEPLKVMAEGYYSRTNEEIIGRDMEDGTYQYILRRVVEPWTITIGPDKASEITNEEYISGMAVWSYKTALFIRSDKETTAYIYSLDGALSKRLEIKEGETKEIMNRGVYVVVIDNKRYKVFIQ